MSTKWSKKDEEIVGGLINWFFDEVVKEDKVMRKFKKEVLPVLMQSVGFRVWWIKSASK